MSRRGALACLSALLLVGCAAGGLRPGQGDKGDLGALREPRPGDIYAQMGEEYIREHQPDVALRKLKRGLEIDPDNGRVHAVLGLLYERLGETQLAAQQYARSTELEPQNPYFHNARGSFLCQQGQYDQAEQEFQLTLRNPLYQPRWAVLTNAGVCALRAGRRPAAERYLREALSANPSIALALEKLAQILVDRGDYAAAHTYLERYTRAAGPTPQGLLLRLRAAHGRGDQAAAARLAVELRQRYPDAPETQTARGLSDK
jgi:type IV pilus assembly protein PilF